MLIKLNNWVFVQILAGDALLLMLFTHCKQFGVDVLALTPQFNTLQVGVL